LVDLRDVASLGLSRGALHVERERHTQTDRERAREREREREDLRDVTSLGLLVFLLLLQICRCHV